MRGKRVWERCARNENEWAARQKFEKKKKENNWELMEKGDNAQPRTSDLPHPSDEGLPGTGGPEKTETIKKITGGADGVEGNSRPFCRQVGVGGQCVLSLLLLSEMSSGGRLVESIFFLTS